MNIPRVTQLTVGDLKQLLNQYDDSTTVYVSNDTAKEVSAYEAVSVESDVLDDKLLIIISGGIVDER
ncbi:hypothetical protein [Loigolactobacillus coryniformis]|uniref:hypothetical protein n=1 Tax=Loigolactobacillus coryniformis TaxID=1610 RepID=UPI00345D4176